MMNCPVCDFKPNKLIYQLNIIRIDIGEIE